MARSFDLDVAEAETRLDELVHRCTNGGSFGVERDGRLAMVMDGPEDAPDAPRATPFPPARRVPTARCAFSVHEAGPADGVPLLMLHGWPELAHSWAPVCAPLAEAGYRCVMPDLKGFGASDRPDDASAYAASEVTADFCALLDALGIARAVIVGHDWGGALAWPMGWQHPGRVLGVASVCTPHPPRAPAPPLSIFERRFGPEHYICRFQDEDAADAAFGGREAAFFRFLFRPGVPRARWAELFPEVTHIPDRFAAWSPEGARPPVMGEADLAVYERAYAASGHRTPTHVYRNIDRNWSDSEGADLTVRCPTLMITAARDVLLPPEASEGMEDRCPDLTRAEADCGHWAMWEAPEAVTAALLSWLTARFPA